MKTLLLIRPAKSSRGDKGKDDWERPLSQRGKKNGTEMAKFLQKKDLIPQVILSSAAVRARKTCEILIDKAHFRGDIYYLNSLYLGEQDTYLKEINRLPDNIDCALVIGHNPGLEMFYQVMSGGDKPMRATSIACIRIFIDTWKEFDYECKFDSIDLWNIKD